MFFIPPKNIVFMGLGPFVFVDRRACSYRYCISSGVTPGTWIEMWPFFLGEALKLNPWDRWWQVHIVPNVGQIWFPPLNLVGGWPNRSEKICFGQLGWLFPIYGKIKHIPNHQPDSMVNRNTQLPSETLTVEATHTSCRGTPGHGAMPFVSTVPLWEGDGSLYHWTMWRPVLSSGIST